MADFPTFQILTGDSFQMLKTREPESVDCIITSPPYWNLRDYDVAGQIGLEKSIGVYLRRLHRVFDQCHRVLKSTGTIWINIGDTRITWRVNSSIGPKNLAGIPWRLAFGLQKKGWILRQDIIWQKPNPMPESAPDRCTTAHEYIFLLSKCPKYYWHKPGMREGSSSPVVQKPAYGWQTGPDSHSTLEHSRPGRRRGYVRSHQGIEDRWDFMTKAEQCAGGHNRRSVWTCASDGIPGAEHRAAFPESLIEPMVRTGCPPGGTVLDPFSGSGTTGVAALKQFKNYIGIELKPEYAEHSMRRLDATRKSLTLPLFDTIAI